jgi:hypothetical protein
MPEISSNQTPEQHPAELAEPASSRLSSRKKGKRTADDVFNEKCQFAKDVDREFKAQLGVSSLAVGRDVKRERYETPWPPSPTTTPTDTRDGTQVASALPTVAQGTQLAGGSDALIIQVLSQASLESETFKGAIKDLVSQKLDPLQPCPEAPYVQSVLQRLRQHGVASALVAEIETRLCQEARAVMTSWVAQSITDAESWRILQKDMRDALQPHVAALLPPVGAVRSFYSL